MDNSFKIVLIQADINWESPAENLELYDSMLDNIDADLVILPEMFSTGFTMNPSRVAETMQGESISWMKCCAERTGSAVCGSLAIEENGHFYNRLLFVKPSGEIQHYDKRHLFTMAGEPEAYAAGKDRLVLE